jgi:hypothetical protein
MSVDPRDSRGAGVRWPKWMVAAVAALAAACGGSSTPTASTTPAPTTTDVFTGTLPAGGVVFHSFNVAQQGTLTATLTSLTPQTTITVGIGIGQPSGATCTLLSASESAKMGYATSGTIAVGAYCVEIYDLGNVQGSDDYTITVTHP